MPASMRTTGELAVRCQARSFRAKTPRQLCQDTMMRERSCLQNYLCRPRDQTTVNSYVHDMWRYSERHTNVVANALQSGVLWSVPDMCILSSLFPLERTPVSSQAPIDNRNADFLVFMRCNELHVGGALARKNVPAWAPSVCRFSGFYRRNADR